ncbi:glutamate ABC transporter substrate-binding protein [Starkeya sp. ORNL1]|uniref:glutamate ABC transporter substrate-binding protein n=1 Tax=Starkeya sp. ORNL1 TaxID=2709380 RepID=UPI0014640B5C|nr:glutamate ABC transporter substrate-binding protein [Starkeya sp. ORNL1]QJP13525.1 glutamate ABC transporter substrate-binding protein [Starkeya sp. ORNL1]
MKSRSITARSAAMTLLGVALVGTALCGEISSAAADTKPSFPAGSTMEKLATAGKIRVGVKFDQPGLSQKNLRGDLEGFDIEIVKVITEGLGLKPGDIEWIETSSSNREPFLQQNKVDMVVASYGVNEKRKKVVSFAGPYVTNGQDVMVRKGNPTGLKDVTSLAGQKTCVINGSEGQAAVEKYSPQADMVGFDVISKCLSALKNGSVVGVVTNTHILAGLVAKDPQDFELLNQPFAAGTWGIGIAHGDTAFCKFIDDQLTKAAGDGVYEKAWADTVGKGGLTFRPLPPLEPCA